MWEITRAGVGVCFVTALLVASVVACGSDAGAKGEGSGSGGGAAGGSAGAGTGGGQNLAGAGNGGAAVNGTGGMGQGAAPGGSGNPSAGGAASGSGGTPSAGGSAGAPSGGAPGRVSTGLDPNAVVGQLMPSDALKICQAESRYVTMRISNTEAIRSACVLFAGLSGGGAPTAAECQMSVNDCISMPDQISTMQDCTIDPAGLASCSATVGELETCLTASVEAVKVALASITCDIYALSPADYQARLAALQQPPPACAPLQMKCPAAFATP